MLKTRVDIKVSNTIANCRVSNMNCLVVDIHVD